MTEFGDTHSSFDSSLPVVWSSFLVRFYREGENGAWRGEVLHLQTREKRYFSTTAQIEAFLQTHAPGFMDQTLVVPENSESPDIS